MGKETKKWFYDLQAKQQSVAAYNGLELNTCLTQEVNGNVVYELWSANTLKNGDNVDILFMMCKMPHDRHFMRTFIDINQVDSLGK